MKVIEIDLARGKVDLPSTPIQHDVRFVVRWGYYPLGLVEVDRDFDTLTTPKSLEAIIYDELGAELWAHRVAGTLESIEQMTKSDLPPISIAVCTRDRVPFLIRCLDALLELDYPCFEVLVVDNASKDSSIRPVVEGRGFRYIREGIPGLDWARNRAIREATHDIVAFIDDDAIASKGWLYGIARGFQRPETMAVTGLVLPDELETPAQLAFEKYGGMSKGFGPKTIRKEELEPARRLWAAGWGVGANMAFRRELFDHIGGFDPALDVGTATRGGGDIEFFYRLVAAGHILRYEPMAYVYHTHRREHDGLMRQIADNGRSFPAFLLTVSRNYRDQRADVLQFLLGDWLWGWLLKRGLKATLQRDWQTTRFVAAEMRGSLGALSGYRQAQRVARQHMQVVQTAQSAGLTGANDYGHL